MTKSKKPNPIEDAIGNRAKTTKDVPRIVDTEAFKNHVAEQTPETPSQPKMSEQAKQEIRNLPIPQDLEELNLQTIERLQDEWPEDSQQMAYDPTTKKATIVAPVTGTNIPPVNLPPIEKTIPVLKPALPPVTETSTQESPPQETLESVIAKRKEDTGHDFTNDGTPPYGAVMPKLKEETLQGIEPDESSAKAFEITKNVKKSNEQTLQEVNSGLSVDEIDEYQDAEKHDKHVELREKEFNFEGMDDHDKHVATYNNTAEKLGIPKIETEFHPVAGPIPNIDKLPSDFTVKHTYDTGVVGCIPAEDIELTNLKKYILEDGFVLATVAFHIVSLCAEPLTTPSTTNWDFADRAKIPDMVLALLNQPGYLEGIWPSLKIIMGDNKGNPAWTAGISTTIAFFDVIRTLPTLKEMHNEEK